MNDDTPSSDGETTTPSLYRRILGDKLDVLPQPLRKFHESPGGARAQGTFHVTRGPGRLRGWLAALLGFPPTAPNVPLELQVAVEGDRERWIRRFDKHPLETLQWQSRNLLIESGGPMRFGFELIADKSSLRYRLVRAWFCLVPLPRWLSPRLEGIESHREGGWNVEVKFALPVVGMLIRYEGFVRFD